MDLFKEILKGNKVALAKGITLLESSLETDIISSQELISNCLPHSGDSIRIGITGIPGVGKSTFIETFGKILTEKGKKVAVLAIDPTSEKTHGSILGDKSRMNKLAVDENAFIRPSPSSGTLGGVSSKTRDSIILCEAAGFDVILIETVGVGQSETIVNTICDFFLLLMLAGAGDELQGIKRGIMELADMVVITKSDGDNLQKANNAKQEYQMALHLFPASENGWTPKVSVCSALEDTGIKDIWETISTYNQQMISNNYKDENRKKQDVYWLHHIIKEDLGNKKYNSLILEGKLDELETKLKKGGTIKQLLEGLSIY
ncbi:MAG: methylmalonyl Co-A mutase-associated GTPase MeaB [Flavobacteriales bacterium]|nr:methylmalonyl Co-A mutase-associated GTPase MeaB [Flavobacteriales bacterium]MBT5353479.1 methylmalonyl Co-A mutase-associated GTPase MeaB [Flavobacteriales bacterium]MBT7620352.1 methylmalonyl Co-A mutase-associated GTPase MeaB [Flavobacteriales bacterium]MBT7725885.1 methylmalonyl Co-A mutase-associated GTPase MeaB [Flavobacteriales bacterium]